MSGATQSNHEGQARSAELRAADVRAARAAGYTPEAAERLADKQAAHRARPREGSAQAVAAVGEVFGDAGGVTVFLATGENGQVALRFAPELARELGRKLRSALASVGQMRAAEAQERRQGVRARWQERRAAFATRRAERAARLPAAPGKDGAP